MASCSMMRFTPDFRPLADSNQFIAVYSQSLVTDSKGNSSTTWNNKGPYDNGTDEIGFAEAMNAREIQLLARKKM
jgi:poly(3-hydroxybutyrate) depolymerase